MTNPKQALTTTTNPKMVLTQPPFDFLSDQERQRLEERGEVVFMQRYETLDENLAKDFFLVLKGRIHQLENDSFISELRAGDYFDAAQSSKNNVSYQYVSQEETLVYRLDGETLHNTLKNNEELRRQFSNNFQERVQAAQSRRVGNETQALMTRMVKECYLREAHYIDCNASISDATCALIAANTKHILVRENEKIGVFSTTNLCDAVAKKIDLQTTCVKEFTQFKLITINENEQLSEALLLMLDRRIHRLPVTNNDGEIIGILGQTDLMSYFTNQSHLISITIERSQNIEQLTESVEKIGAFIRQQYNTGIKTTVISRIVKSLNIQTFKKVWQLIAPEELRQQSTVIVMGSEGRGEQILRTDQDNALIIDDDCKIENIAAIANLYNETLAKLGYPLCKGGVMMNNEKWCQPVSKWKENVTQWLREPIPAHLISLATFLDSDIVCGKASRLYEINQHLYNARGNAYTGFTSHFAKAALQFGDLSQWWQKFIPGGDRSSKLDLKKSGIFPIVHGVRTLAFENAISVSGTHARLIELVALNILDKEQATNIAEALDFLMGQRLKYSLDSNSKGENDNLNPDTLSAMERDLLKESLSIVKELKEILNHRYSLNRFT